MTDTPHFAYPFRINGAVAAEHEQDSPDEIFEAAIAVIGTPKGTRNDLPAFGLPDLPFTKIVRRDIIQVLEKWEPRASYLVTVQPDAIEQMMTRIKVGVQGGTDV